MTPTPIRWRKASYSGNQGNCVELAHSGDLVRDSKNPGGPVLECNLTALLHDIKLGRFDR
jgi:Domain of unknown function (DUF397)